jgi:DNA-binding beta-propeller fold protein YncE
MLRRRDCLGGFGALAISSGCRHHRAVEPVEHVPPSREPQKTVLVAGGDDEASNVAVKSKLVEPFGVARESAGNLFIVESSGQRVRRIDAAGTITPYAGSGTKGAGGDGGPATAAELNMPHHLGFAPRSQDLFIADTLNNRVRRVDARTGIISTLAGTGEKGFAGDGGPAVRAAFSGIYCLAFTHDGQKMYLADLGNRRIRVVDLATQVVETVAGNGERGVPPDGAIAREAPLVDPRAVAVDHQGNVYILERNGHALRVVDPAGKIRTVAGTGQQGFGGDGGDALAATFNGPKHLTVDDKDDVVIADTENHVIRKYLPRQRRVVRVAGTGHKGNAGVGGSPLAVELNRPHGVFVEGAGRESGLLITDSDNHRILGVGWSALQQEN